MIRIIKISVIITSATKITYIFYKQLTIKKRHEYLLIHIININLIRVLERK